MNIRLAFVALAIGFSGMVLQVLLLRELLTVFQGNDLAIGIIIANWLIIEAIGAFYLGKRIERERRKILAFLIISILFVISLPLALFLTRIIRDIIGVMPGVGIGVFQIFYSSLLVLLIPTILHGAHFVFTCKLFAQYSNLNTGTEKNATSVGAVYILETIGHVIGAIVFTYLLIPHFNSFTIIFGIGILTLSACILLAFYIKESTITRIFSFALVVVLGLFTVLFAVDGDDRLHRLSIGLQWPDQEVVHHQHSPYGNVTVIEREGEFTFFADGMPVLTTPNPDVEVVEEFVHFAMLMHERPEKIALLSGGAGGVISEILSHNTVKMVDYTELDPLIIELVQKFPTQLTEKEFNDPRVNTYNIDGRRFLQLTKNKYDLLFIGISNPSNLRTNRLFTEEFFALAKARLRDGGLLVVSLPGSLTYLSNELRDLNAVIVNTLNTVFDFQYIIIGNNNIFIASDSANVSLTDANLLYKRIKERKLDLQLFTLPYLEYRLASRWLTWFQESLKDGTVATNQDFLPKGFFYSLSYWNAIFSPYMKDFFAFLKNLKLEIIALAIALFTFFILVLRHRIRRLHKWSIPYSIGTTGFASMAFDLMIIFAFQVMFGFALHWIGLLIAAFMTGIAAGGFVTTSNLSQIKNKLAYFIKLEIAVGAFAAILPLFLLVMAPHLGKPVFFIAGQWVLVILAIISGALVGMKFPIANKIYLADSKNFSHTVGLLYGSDLIGGWIGGLVVAVVLLPVLGLAGTALVLVLIKISSLIILVTAKKEMLQK